MTITIRRARTLGAGAFTSCLPWLLAAGCAAKLPPEFAAPDPCRPPQCPAGTKLRTDIGQSDGAQWMSCVRPDGKRHGPFQICQGAEVTQRGAYANDVAVGRLVFYEHGRATGSQYFSRGSGGLACRIEGATEHCEFSRMPLPPGCWPAGQAERRVVLVGSERELHQRLGCPAPAAGAQQADQASQPEAPIDWARYRVAITRVAVPDPPEHLSYTPRLSIDLSGDRAVMQVWLHGWCGNSPAGHDFQSHEPPLKELVIAIEVPRTIVAVRREVRITQMPNPQDCTTLP